MSVGRYNTPVYREQSEKAEFMRVTLEVEAVDPQAARERRGLAPPTSLRVLWEGVRNSRI